MQSPQTKIKTNLSWTSFGQTKCDFFVLPSYMCVVPDWEVSGEPGDHDEAVEEVDDRRRGAAEAQRSEDFALGAHNLR